MQLPVIVVVQYKHMCQYGTRYEEYSVLHFWLSKKRVTCTTQWYLLQCYILNIDMPPPVLWVMVSYSVSLHGLIIWSLYSVNHFFPGSIHFNLVNYGTKCIFLENLFILWISIPRWTIHPGRPPGYIFLQMRLTFF